MEYAGWLLWVDGKVFNQNCKVAMLQPVVCCDCVTKVLYASISVSKKKKKVFRFCNIFRKYSVNINCWGFVCLFVCSDGKSPGCECFG